MEYVMLKDVCAINMGQSPDSDSYNNITIMEKVFHFFKEMPILEKDIQSLENGARHLLRWRHLRIY